MKTKNCDIRSVLHNELMQSYERDNNTYILHELGLCQGLARIDIAVINGKLIGYEIKSESDNLDRLPSQIEIYNKVLDKVIIVAGQNHIPKITKLVPDWWGILSSEFNSADELIINLIREPGENHHLDAFSLAQLLWRQEALNLLNQNNAAKGYKSKKRWDIWKRVAEVIPLNELKNIVRNTLKTRNSWRSDLIQV